MRIISQDGQMNLSLDNVHLSTAKTANCWVIRARDNFWDRPVELAEYSTKEKCQEVFDFIVDGCAKEYKVIQLPKDKDVVV